MSDVEPITPEPANDSHGPINGLDEIDVKELTEEHAVSPELLRQLCAEGRVTSWARGQMLQWNSPTDGRAADVFRTRESDRRDGDKKVEWPKGQTTHVNAVRWTGAKNVLVVEGYCQQLAAASWAPEGFDVVGMNGCDGIHDKIPQEWAEGKNIWLYPDADRNTNERVAGAVGRVTSVLAKNGAETVRLGDLGGFEKDGVDDVLNDVRPERRTAVFSRSLQAASWLHGGDGGDRLERMRAKLLDRAALKKLPRPEYLIKGVIRVKSSARINGDPGSGKSLHLLDMSGCVGAGIPWHGCETRKGLVVYVIAEGVEGFTLRVDAWEKQYDREMEGVIFYPEPIQVLGRQHGELAESEEWKTFRELCRELRPDLVILDTQRRVTLAAEENSPSDLQKAVAALDDLKRDVGCTWFLGHHTPKNGHGGSGGGSLWGSVDTELETSKSGKGLGARFFLENTKQKDGVDGTKIEFSLVVHDVTDATADGFDPMDDRVTSVVLAPVEDRDRTVVDDVDTSVPEGTPIKDKIWTVLWRVYREQTFTRAEAKSLMAKEGVQPKTFLNKFGELRKEALVIEESASRFRMRAYFREPLGTLPNDPTVAEVVAMRATPGPAGHPATSLGTP